ncbi:MAG: 4Fe-4S dicluster domain-containing protein [bacterium]
MTSKQLKQFLTYLKKDNMIAGPIRDGEVLNFNEVDDINDLEFSNKIPLRSFKRFLLPVREVMSFGGRDASHRDASQCVSTNKKMALVGLTTPDLRAITILNHIFEKDPYYQERMKKTLIIGYAEMPDEYKGMFAVRYEENILEHLQFDIFIAGETGKSALTDEQKNAGILRPPGARAQNDAQNKREKCEYKIFTGSEDGQRVLDKFGYKNYENVQFAGLIPEEGAEKNVIAIRKAMEKMSPDNEIFKGFGKKCIECGRCSIICPLCFCFCLEDGIPAFAEAMAGKPPLCKGGEAKSRDALQCASTGKCAPMKERKTTTCFYSEFSEVAGGHKFLKNPAERIFNWYEHKFVRIPDELSVAGCVSCGRCAKVCPAGISIKEVMKEILDFRF